MRHDVGAVTDFPDGGSRLVTIGRRSIGVFRVGGRFYALRNRCPHQGGPLCTGPVQPWVESSQPGEFRLDAHRWRVACPWHNWEYDLETGQSWFDPRGSRVRAYPVTVEPVKGPYVAETYRVDVHDDRVLVDV